MEMYYGKPTPNSFSDILDQYSTEGINSVQTSTVPFLNFWKNHEKRVAILLGGLGISSIARRIAFEYPTSSYGSNKASMTDLMIFCDDWRIAVEAKYKEITVKYETVAEWNKERSANRSRVISHWLEMLSPFVNAPLNEELVGRIPYQLLHRVASSCEDRSKNACTVYQLFYDDTTKGKIDNFAEKLRYSAECLSPSTRLKIFLHKIRVEFIGKGIDKESALQTLKSRELYEFAEEQFLRLVP